METIGSIIYLKEGSQKLMIIYFNEENIDNVIFEGYCDQDETRFQELFKEMMDNLDEDVQRGTVQQKDSYGLI